MLYSDIAPYFKNASHVAKFLNVSTVAVHYWIQRGGKIPTKYHPMLEPIIRDGKVPEKNTIAVSHFEFGNVLDNFESLADMARQLEVSSQAVWEWKNRNRIPEKYVPRVKKLCGIRDDASSKNKGLSRPSLYIHTSDDSKYAVKSIFVLEDKVKVVCYLKNEGNRTVNFFL